MALVPFPTGYRSSITVRAIVHAFGPCMNKFATAKLRGSSRVAVIKPLVTGGIYTGGEKASTSAILGCSRNRRIRRKSSELDYLLFNCRGNGSDLRSEKGERRKSQSFDVGF